ncbi:MAG TPA: hypothetical protein VKX17_02275 [Planctomycetota bacterium]|nr:hypothetical protein [Planctomycetota bacterium]
MMMFVAGGLIWANVAERIAARGHYAITTDLGWPIGAIRKSYWQEGVEDPEFHVTPFFRSDLELALSGGRKEEISYAYAVVDALIALTILFAVWFVCERWIAWRAARKGD